jgi:hypothetical protein
VLILFGSRYESATKAGVRPLGGDAMQVRKRLLLVLPEGDKYEYVCPHCGSTCGDTIIKDDPSGRRPM